MKQKAVRLLVLLVLLVGSFCGSGVTPVQATTYTIDEPFNTNTRPDSWTFLSSANMVNNWLRLTPDLQNQAGAVYYNLNTFSPNDHFLIEFDYASYGGSTPTHADGLTFFMSDGIKIPTKVGGDGGGLGYYGIDGAYFAVGMDEYNDVVSIWNSTLPVTSTPASIETGSRENAKHVRITYSEGHISVWLAGEEKISAYDLASPLPVSVRVGFSASTGSGTNKHEIRNVVIKTLSLPGAFFVKPGASGSADCSNWANACILQTALAFAHPGDEVWVAEGVYKPTTVAANRVATFQLLHDVAVYGGFDGQSDDSLADQDPVEHLTILSGDIDNNDSQSPVITDLATVTDNMTNSFQVVTGEEGARLDGFTITGGFSSDLSLCGAGIFLDSNSSNFANLTIQGNRAITGGGMCVKGGSPVLTNVTFLGNMSGLGGGLLIDPGNPMLTNVNFIRNSAYGGQGGGIYINSGSPMLIYVSFVNNSAGDGGGLYSNYSNPGLMNVTFSSNYSETDGGGIYNQSGSLTLVNVTFNGNSAGIGVGGGGEAGGGMYGINNNSTLTNVTFSGNSAAVFGGAMFLYDSNASLTNVTVNHNLAWNGGGLYISDSSCTIRNSILWGNVSPYGNQITIDGLTPDPVVISDSLVQGGYAGGTNILTADPKLGLLGNYGGFTQTIPLHPGSSALDVLNASACPPTDQRGIERPQGEKCDLGAFEGWVYWTVHLPFIKR